MLQRIFCRNRSCTLLYYNTNTDVAKYNRILYFSKKLSNKICVNHIEHEPFLLTVEEIYFLMITHKIHQLLHMQGCSLYFLCSIMVMYPIERIFYQNNFDTTTLKTLPV